MSFGTRNYPFRAWVPKWLGTLAYVYMTIPAMLISGAYSSNAAEMAGSLGIISEHIQYSTFVSSIGMIVFNPFTVSFLEVRRPKMVYLGGLSVLFVLSSVCAYTTSVPVLMICSFIMGFVRMMILYNTLFGCLEYLTGRKATAFLTPAENPTHDEIARQAKMRTALLPPIYLFFMVLGQSGNFLTAVFAFEHNWQHVYFVMMGITLIALLLTVVTMKYSPSSFSFGDLRLHQALDVCTAAVALLSFTFVLTYGKTLGWFDHHLIRWATATFFVSLGLFILQQNNASRAYLNLELFSSRTVLIGLSIYVFGMAFSSSSLLTSVFAGMAFELDAYQTAALANYSSLGFLVGAVTAFLMGRWGLHVKYIFSVGFVFISVSAAYMYFQYQTMSSLEKLIFPTVMRSAGTLILYSMTGILGMSRITPSTITSWMFMMLLCRSLFGPVVGVASYVTALEERSQHYVQELSRDIDMVDPDVAAMFARTRMGVMRQGKSYEQGTAIASMSLKGRVMKQAMLSSLKEITGWLFALSTLCAAFYLIVRYSTDKWGEIGQV